MKLLLGWCIPSTGHAYAGNWARGLPFAAARAGTLIGMLVSEGQQNRDGNRNLLPVASGLLYLTFTVWEVIDASSQVDKYNDDLRNALQKSSYKFDLSPIEKGIALRFVWEI